MWAQTIGVWAVVAWLMMSGDRVRERLVGAVLSDDTEFAAGFSEPDSGKYHRQPARDVRERLGSPLHEHLFFWPVRNNCSSIVLAGEAVVTAQNAEGCKSLGIEHGTTRAVVARVISQPEEACWPTAAAVTADFTAPAAYVL